MERKTFSQDIAERAAEALKSYADIIAKTRAASIEDTGTFEVVISTEDVDRSGEVIKQDGLDIANYMNNPVVLWAHDYTALPIGVTDEIIKQDGKTIAKGRFAPESANPFAQQVRRLYDAKLVNTNSVGLIVRRMEGKTIVESELLEHSFVPVPANPFALSLRKMQELALDTDMLALKGIAIKEETEKAEGDACTLEDGTEGEMKPDAEGTLVCTPKVTETGEADKGALGDAIAAEDVWEQKWANLDALCDIIDAFFGVYLDNGTPVEQFSALVSEMITLLQPLAGTTETTEAGLKAALEKKVKQHFVLRKGFTPLTEADKDTLLADILTAIKQNGAGSTAAGTDGEETRDGASQKERSKRAGEDSSEGLKEFLAGRQVLRELATVVSDSLERMNKIAREKKLGK